MESILPRRSQLRCLEAALRRQLELRRKIDEKIEDIEQKITVLRIMLKEF